MATRDEFLAVLARHLGSVDEPASIDPAANLRMLGLNSMRAVDLVVDIEDSLGIGFPDDAFTDEVFETADTIWAVVDACPVEEAS